MSLRSLIRRPIPDALATATAATPATVPPKAVPSVAAVAGVAVATPPSSAGELERWLYGLASLRHAPPPGRFGPDGWAALLRDAEGLLREWGAVAHGRGWRGLGLFGCSPGFARRLDRDGLAMLLGGRPVLAMTEQAATIGNPRGAPNTFRRAAVPGAVLLWEA